MSIARTLLFNRFAATALAVAAVAAAVNLYVIFNDDGILRGRVVDGDGAPVGGAEVVLYRPALIGFEEIDTQTTDEDGRFGFRVHGQHHPALQVRAEGFPESDLHRVRLYFRNQNTTLREDLTIGRDEGEG